MNAALSLSHDVGKKGACEALQVPRATFYRFCNTGKDKSNDRPAPPLSLSPEEKSVVLDILHSERFCDKTPYQVYAALLDEGHHHCSISTMYRLLNDEHGDVKERRRQVSRPAYSKPELLANGPNQVWSWDITKLKSHTKWTYFYLYVIIDIFSRYVVGWMVAHREQDALAKRFIQESCMKQNIERGQLTIHADRGSSMKSKTVANLLVDLGVIKTHSRPHVSNDNPYSEAQFKTLKYCPEFPGNFGSIQDARAFCRTFFDWYNNDHHHSGIALMTPQQVHCGLAEKIYSKRCETLEAAFRQKPLRFKNKIPTPEKPPEAVWINKPESDDIRV